MTDHDEIAALREALKALTYNLQAAHARAETLEALYRRAAENCAACRLQKKCRGACGVERSVK